MQNLPASSSPGPTFDTTLLNVSDLVGREVKLYSDQLPGKELMCKVLAAQERTLNVGATGSTLIDSLVNRQTPQRKGSGSRFGARRRSRRVYNVIKGSSSFQVSFRMSRSRQIVQVGRHSPGW